MNNIGEEEGNSSSSSNDNEDDPTLPSRIRNYLYPRNTPQHDPNRPSFHLQPNRAYFPVHLKWTSSMLHPGQIDLNRSSSTREPTHIDPNRASSSTPHPDQIDLNRASSPLQPAQIEPNRDTSPLHPGPIEPNRASSPLHPGPIKPNRASSPLQPGQIEPNRASSPLHPGQIKPNRDSLPLQPGQIDLNQASSSTSQPGQIQPNRAFLSFHPNGAFSPFQPNHGLFSNVQIDPNRILPPPQQSGHHLPGTSLPSHASGSGSGNAAPIGQPPVRTVELSFPILDGPLYLSGSGWSAEAEQSRAQQRYVSPEPSTRLELGPTRHRPSDPQAEPNDLEEQRLNLGSGGGDPRSMILGFSQLTTLGSQNRPPTPEEVIAALLAISTAENRTTSSVTVSRTNPGSRVRITRNHQETKPDQAARK